MDINEFTFYIIENRGTNLDINIIAVAYAHQIYSYIRYILLDYLYY